MIRTDISIRDILQKGAIDGLTARGVPVKEVHFGSSFDPMTFHVRIVPYKLEGDPEKCVTVEITNEYFHYENQLIRAMDAERFRKHVIKVLDEIAERYFAEHP